MSDPKRPWTDKPRGADDYAIGADANGNIHVMTPDEAAKAMGRRDAEDAAFAALDTIDDEPEPGEPTDE